MANNKSLLLFNSKELSRIIDKLGSVPRIFNSEAQFQFALAWEIKENFNCEVRLEELSRILKDKKDYTDIILEENGLKIAIELKYKTESYENSDFNAILFHQGASDLGCYDFLKDVSRIESLTDDSTEGLITSCLKGYSIILTNDKLYWTPSNTDTIYREFRIGGIPSGKLTFGEHQWWNKQNVRGSIPSAAKYRSESITFRNDYTYSWKDYYCDKNTSNGTFKYMVIEVERPINEQIDYLKDYISTSIAKRIEQKYKNRWTKCIDIATSASWWYKNYSICELKSLDIEKLIEEVFNEIDTGEIF